MGRWLKVLDVRTNTTVEAVKILTDDQIEARIVVAERRLEQTCNLDIETSRVPPWANAKDVPWRFRGLFNAFPSQEQLFYQDARMAALMILDRLALNPREYAYHNVKGASAGMPPQIPTDVYTIMARWSAPVTLERV